MKFSLTPCPGENGFQQWKDAISVATRMPSGLPPSIRQKVLRSKWNFEVFFVLFFVVFSFGFH